MPAWLIIVILAAYMALLFALAWQRDRDANTKGFEQSPYIYALALAVYCTSWTYFGAVGTAASSGLEYLPIYLGPALVFLCMPRLLQRIGDIAERESVTSISDFLSARYGKSRLVAALVTVGAAAGSLPYIALQLKSVGMSFQSLMSTSGEAITPQSQGQLVFITALGLALFAILFGARHSDMTRNNAGLMRLLAFEALLKLCALVAVCLLSITLLTGEAAIKAPSLPEVFPMGDVSSRFITITVLSMAAILCLPRQFHVAIIERRNTRENRVARWVFPLYLAVTSLVVLPITLAGLGVLPPTVPADLYVLELPLQSGDGFLAMFVFLGGFSAATGMVVVAAVALSNMVTNDIVVPLMLRLGKLNRFSGDAGANLLAIRRFVIITLLLLAYGYYSAAGSSEALAQIGLLSFAAAAQLAPLLLGAIYWRGARQPGAVAGLSAGLTLWVYTLFAPAVIGHSSMINALPYWLDPYALFGFSFGDSLVHGVFWSLGINIFFLIVFSLRARERLRDRIQAAAFVGDLGEVSQAPVSASRVTQNVTPNGLKALAARFLNSEAVDHAFARFHEETGVETSGSLPADWRMIQRTERLLASVLGASSARVVMSSAVGGADVALGDVLSILDQQTQAQRFDRHMLQSMLENIEQGISVVDQDQRIVAWNSAYADMFAYPESLVSVGVPVARLIEHNIRTGWIDGDPAEEAQRRIAHIRAGRPHMYERQNPDGRYLRIIGSPMPGGGYVTTFTDITKDKQREQALLDANEQLEQRVTERTRDLQDMARDLDAARQDAEGANASKTRFLAAASHDLLQPLNAARLFLGALDSNNQEQARLVEKADRSIQSADELLKGLLDISRLDHGRIEPNLTDIPLGPLLEDLVDEASPMAMAAGLRLRVAPTSLSVRADPDFLQSILRNFLSNARRYTRTGGIVLGARRTGETLVRIEVWDSGPGIPETQRSKLFEEFQRLEEADNMGVRGAGLGLSIAQRMARLMGAEINVRSSLGQGSVFSVTVPRVERQRKRGKAITIHPQRNHADPTDLSGLRVLCVDDEPQILEAMTALLRKWGCSVVTAKSASETVEAFNQSAFDVLVADYQLSDTLTGLDLVTRYASALPDRTNATLLTAEATRTTESRAEALGIGILAKPADPVAIRQFLEDCLSRLKPQAAE